MEVVENIEIGKLTVEPRQERGKGAARRLRAQGKIPGIYYGKGEEPLAITLDPRAFMRALDPQKKQNTVFTVSVGSGKKALTAMLREYQSDALSSALTHIDLVSVDITKNVTVEVPVEFVGKAAGTVDGGQIHAVYRRIPVRCKPTDIPTLIQVDITSLHIGDALHIDEITLPEGVVAEIDGSAWSFPRSSSGAARSSSSIPASALSYRGRASTYSHAWVACSANAYADRQGRNAPGRSLPILAAQARASSAIGPWVRSAASVKDRAAQGAS